MSRLSNRDKEELSYLNTKNEIKEFTNKVGYYNILKYMIEDLDCINDINNTQSMYLFQIISSLEKALEIYPRLEQHV
jgi:hypothetical protein